MIEMKAGYKEWSKKSGNGMCFIDYIINADGEPVAKRCTKCGELLDLSKFSMERRNTFDGKYSMCRDCDNLRRRVRYINTKEQESKRKQVWERNNKPARRVINQRRKARERSLPDTLTPSQEKLMKTEQNHKCVLSGAMGDDLHIEHFIPVSWGAGGTTFENCYYMDGSLNLSKGNRNPFEWIKKQPEAYQERFHGVLVPMLAERNGMTVQAFTSYVYECEKAYLNSKQQALV